MIPRINVSLYLVLLAWAILTGESVAVKTKVVVRTTVVADEDALVIERIDVVVVVPVEDCVWGAS